MNTELYPGLPSLKERGSAHSPTAEKKSSPERQTDRRVLAKGKKFRTGEFIAEAMIKSIALISFAVIVLIFIFVFREAAPLFTERQQTAAVTEEVAQETYGEETPAPRLDRKSTETESNQQEASATLQNLAGREWQPVSLKPKFGLVPLIVGSFKVTLIAIVIAAPLAILAALFTSFFAPRGLKKFLKPAIEFLSGFPSVVIGFFALVEIATLAQDLFGTTYRLNAFVGGVALALAVIPIIFTVTDDAIAAIPRSLTEASLALGATRWQTALFVILPAATPGIYAAVLLGVGRAFGETMIVLMATGNAGLVSLDLFEPVRTMSATIGAEMAEVVFGDVHYNVLFLIGSILFLFTFVLNAVAEFYVRDRLLRRFRGAS